MDPAMVIRLMGVRGTVPVHGPAYRQFGGATSCVFLRAGYNTSFWTLVLGC